VVGRVWNLRGLGGVVVFVGVCAVGAFCFAHRLVGGRFNRFFFLLFLAALAAGGVYVSFWLWWTLNVGVDSSFIIIISL
jgi:hypothetical protein